MPSSSEFPVAPPDPACVSPPPPAAAPDRLGVLLRVLAVGGYGLWLLLGAALSLGVYREGRSEALLPLGLGCLFVSLGLLAAGLRPGLDWHGWRPGIGQRPTRDALLALLTYLPMMAVAGLVRGSNDFWATRLAGMALLLCSLGSLTYSAWHYRRQLGEGAQRISSTLPISRVVSACYGGGLWLWLCLRLEDGGDPGHTASSHAWVMLMLMLALLLGLIEVLRWQSLQPQAFARPARQDIRPARFVASLFVYALPCSVLLLDDLSGIGLLPVAAAAVSCTVGKTIEQRLYETALGRPAGCG
ncbi:hypothetical protein ASG87_15340 [Frateuria sp. Soil773]|uniref:hypothetical protein n=1 Tax=Frateuria sp. Soil773 TaxID=1736407 RepID=UPI0006FB4325|nr:hypothetical protein [Frateuria sp. Soil773]KRE97625.1 hypothetical protein ASG87_15340 [Frateuria sp. Soil773]